MSELFLQLYLDEDVDIVVASSLRSKGFIAVTTHEAGRTQATDEQQLEHATGRGFTLLTHNRVDFERLARVYLETSRHHAGVIVAVRRPARQIVRRLLVLLDTVTSEEMRDQLRYI